jgi:uncharacterized protein (TIGR01777 family)
MRVFITGGTGLIGKQVVHKLLDRGDEPVVLSRQADKVRRDPSWRKVQVVQGDPSVAGGWDSALDGCDGVINLVGHNIFANRWNLRVKRLLRDSRVYSTEHVVAGIARAHQKPKILVQASAIGYYGTHGDEELTEASPSGSDFMATICREWEEAASHVADHGVRLATIRTGVVLAKGEGAVGAMTPIFKWVPGGAAPVGSGGNPFQPGKGMQWVSWIHLEDIANLFLFALDNPEAQGPINGTSPNPVRFSEFARALAKVLWRPYVPIGPPDAMLDVILGEVAHIVAKGQKVLPTVAQKLGFPYKHPDLREALQTIFAKPPAPPRPERAHAVAAGHHHH